MLFIVLDLIINFSLRGKVRILPYEIEEIALLIIKVIIFIDAEVLVDSNSVFLFFKLIGLIFG